MQTFMVNDFESWRIAARQCLQENLHPKHIQWVSPDQMQQYLFSTPSKSQYIAQQTSFMIPKKFIKIAKLVSYHRHQQKWFLLYEILWRITKGEKNLLQIASDPAVYNMLQMRKQVSRDCHKTKAFVRFRLIEKDQQEYYIAWHQPQHKILPVVAPFFKERFASMNWGIFTPDGFLTWNKKSLTYCEQAIKIDHLSDNIEDLWLTYYRHTFNPARIKLKAMLKEMPRCYWQTMPETKTIKEILVEAPNRVNNMLQQT